MEDIQFFFDILRLQEGITEENDLEEIQPTASHEEDTFKILIMVVGQSDD